MIYSSKKNLNLLDLRPLIREDNIRIIDKTPHRGILIYSSQPLSEKVISQYSLDFVDDINNSFFLSTHKSQENKTVINLDDNILFGNNKTAMIGGPCSAESEKQLHLIASFLHNLGLKVFRAGCFKPRTSPFSFQGTEKKGLKMLRKICDEYGFKLISEVKDSSHFELVENYADIVQVGTKAMYDQSTLRKCGKSIKPVLLKRGFMSTLKEYLQACDFILQEGNWRVILCERGIRTFEPMTRFTLDLGSVSLLKEISHLPIVVDPSHAIGLREHVANLAKSSAAMGIDGLLIEVHNDPPNSLSDSRQAMYFDDFKKMFNEVKQICSTVDRIVI